MILSIFATPVAVCLLGIEVMLRVVGSAGFWWWRGCTKLIVRCSRDRHRILRPITAAELEELKTRIRRGPRTFIEKIAPIWKWPAALGLSAYRVADLARAERHAVSRFGS